MLRRLNLVMLSAPLVLLDWAIVTFLLGLMVWCTEKAEDLLRGVSGVEAIAGCGGGEGGEWLEGIAGGGREGWMRMEVACQRFFGRCWKMIDIPSRTFATS